MYFIVRYNWLQDRLTNKCSVGFFRVLNDAKKFSSFYLPFDKNRNTVAIVKAEEGAIDYSYPVEVFAWSDYLECWVPVEEDDIRRQVTLTY